MNTAAKAAFRSSKNRFEAQIELITGMTALVLLG